MATTENTFTGNGSTTNYSFTFPYIKTTDVKASINGTDTTAFTLANATTVQFNTAPANSAAIRIYRKTDDSALPATFYAGSSIKSSDLNDNFLQNLYSNQESNNNTWSSGTKTIDSSETWAGNNTKIATTGAIDGRVDAKIDTALGSDVLAGTDLIKTVSGGQVTVAHNVNGANSTVNNSNGSVIQDITISAQGHVTSVGSIDLDGRYYTKAQVDSEIDSNIDTAITTDILAGQSITKTNGSGQVTISIANGAIGTNQIADDAVTLAKLGSGALPTDITVASANIVNGTIVAADIATGALDGRYYTETELDAGELDSRYYTETELNAGQLDNRYYTETELNAGQLDNRYYTETEADARFYNLTSGEEIQSGETWSAADNKIATTAAIDARITDLVDDVGGFVPIANETSFPNANPDINNGAGTLVSIKALSSNLTSNGSGVATVTNGTVGNSTVTINGLDNSTTYNAGFGMIVETTTTLNTYTFHRQVPKATEVTTVAGNISNINSVAGNSSNINSAVSNASNINSAVSNASNINSVAGNISNVNTVAGNNTNINTVAGANSNISTVATNITNVNNVGGSIANVNTVAGNLSGVNSFGERYRVASSAPGSGNDEGDLYFDTTANELKVYNGSAWQGGVTASGNFASTTGNTFTGSNTYQDDVKAQFGTSNEFDIFHDSAGHTYMTNSAGNVHIQNPTGENSIRVIPNGSVELYYDNSKRLETTSSGIEVTGDIFGSGKLDLPDNGYLKLGTGDDLLIHHGGTASYIENTTGFLFLHSDSLALRSSNQENYFVAYKDGAVDLYYDNSKKFETTSAGAKVTGEIQGTGDLHLNNGTNSGKDVKFVAASNLFRIYDDVKLTCGTDDDLQIYHDGSHSYIINTTGNLVIKDDSQLILRSPITAIKSADNSEACAKFFENGAVELYYDNSKKLETTSTGVKIQQELYVYQNAADNVNALIENGSEGHGNLIQFKQTTAGSVTRTAYIGHGGDNTGQLKVKNSANIILESGNTTALTLDSSQNALFAGDVDLADSKKIKLGAGDDLQIYHNGSNSYIDDTGTGALIFKSNTYSFRNAADNEQIATFNENGAVELYYDNDKKFETASVGVYSKSIMPSSHETFNLGQNMGRWNDIYIADNGKLRIGQSDDLQIYHNGSSSYIDEVGTGSLKIQTNGTGVDIQKGSSETIARFIADGACELYHDNVKKLETTSDGVTFPDSQRTYFTTSHNRELRFEGKSQGRYIKFQHWDSTGGAESFLETTGNNATRLYYDGSKKLETTSSGVDVTGALTVNGAAIGGGVWEVLGTTDFYSNNGTNSINTGWPSTYTQVKCVLNSLGNASYTDLSMQWYFHSSYGNNGTLNTAQEYKYAARWRNFSSANESTGSNDSTCWRFRNGGGSTYWSGEITFDIGAMAKDQKKGATAELRTGLITVHDSCMHDQSATEDQFIVGAKIFENGGNNFTEGRVTWYGLKYA